MSEKTHTSWRRRIIGLPPIIASALLLVGVAQIKKPPEKAERLERPVHIRIIEVASTTVIPRVRGYGIVRPAQIWQAVAKVSGPVQWINPELKVGATIRKGQDVVRIDPIEFQLLLDQIDTELGALDIKKKSTGTSLNIEKRSVSLLKVELKRNQALKTQGTTSQTIVDTAQRALLTAEGKAQTLRSIIAQVEADQKVLEARRAVAKLNLDRCVISAPFDIRISETLTEETQYATKGQTLVKADGMAVAEATVHIPVGRLRPLVRDTGGPGWLLASADQPSMGPMSLEATLRVKRHHGMVEWPARVSRIADLIDSQTQTIGVIVSVDNPYAIAEPGKRPALMRNTFVEVELKGRPLEKQIVIPVSALHQGRAYVVTSEDRLEIRRPRVAFRQGHVAVIAEGLTVGEKIVLSDLVPAVAGMLLKSKVDESAYQALLDEAAGPRLKPKESAQ